MHKWSLIWLGVSFISLVIAVIIGRIRESKKMNSMSKKLVDECSDLEHDHIDIESSTNLPPPVIGYLKHVLLDVHKPIKKVKLSQSGKIRTNIKSDNWYFFTAEQVVIPSAPGFIWNAKIKMPFGTHLRVLDSYDAGVGAGRVSLCSTFVIASDADKEELNSAALLRYLAEFPWYPTAFLSKSGVILSAKDERSAIATLTDNGSAVSLEFRFNESDEIVSIYSPGRFQRTEAGYKKTPWEGHFSNYQIHNGIRIPTYGEVGWYEEGVLNLVWRGNILGVQYEF
ncbi:MAG: DUF6544 family protein [Sulfurospirillaceae bacterium]|nr:DUF6544 family protein [Sulfurospirillaceae bacterium]